MARQRAPSRAEMQRATQLHLDADEAIERSVEQRPAQNPLQYNRQVRFQRERYPAAVLARFDRLSEIAGEIGAIRRPLSDEKFELQQQRGAINSQIRQRTEPFVASQYGRDVVGKNHPVVLELKESLKPITDRLAKVDEKLELLDERFAAAEGLRARCEDYLRALPSHTPIALCDPAKPKLPKLAEIDQAIAGARAQVAGLQAELHAFRSKPFTAASAKAKVRAFVESLAKEGMPDVTQALDFGGEIELPKHMVNLQVVGGVDLDQRKHAVNAIAGGHVPNAIALFAWLNKAQLIEALEAEVDRYADDANALTAEHRARGEAVLLGQILQAERDEEALVVLAEERKVQVLRRRHADTRAVLGLSSDMPAWDF